jgi:hypothetical protein
LSELLRSVVEMLFATVGSVTNLEVLLVVENTLMVEERQHECKRSSAPVALFCCFAGTFVKFEAFLKNNGSIVTFV